MSFSGEVHVPQLTLMCRWNTVYILFPIIYACLFGCEFIYMCECPSSWLKNKDEDERHSNLPNIPQRFQPRSSARHTGVELCLQIYLHRVVYRVEGNTAGDLVDWTLCKMHTALGIVHITLHYIVQDASNNLDTAGELNLWSILVPHHLTSERRTSQTDHLQRNSYSATRMLLNLPQHLTQVEIITYHHPTLRLG